MTIRPCHFILLSLLTLASHSASAALDRERSQDYYEEALEFFRTEDFSEASIQFRNALQQDPNNLPARIMLGRVLLQQNEPRAAIKELEKAQAMGGDENLILIPLAQAYMEVAEPEHVITGFVAEGHNPEVDGQLLLIQAEAYLQLSDLKRAEEYFLNAGTLLPVDPRPLLGRASLQIGKGKLDKGLALVEEALKLAPDSAEVWTFKALLHRDYGQYREALQAFDKVLEFDPLSSRALTARAAMWLDLGQVEKAREDLQIVEDQGSDSLESIYLRTLMLFREGRQEEAREILRGSADEIRMIKEDYRAKLPNTTLMLGVVAYFEGNYVEAVTNFKAYLNKIPGHVGAMRYMASALLALGDDEGVVKLLKSGSGSEPPRDPMLISMLAEAYRALGNYAAAEKYYAAAMQLAPAVAGIGVRLAASRLDAGRAEDAIRELERLTERFPTMLDAWIQLARVYARSGNAKRAVEVVHEILSRFPDNAQVHNVAGATYLASGDLENARLQLTLAAAADSEQLLPQINLARLARLEGDLASAEAQYRSTLERFPESSDAKLELAELLLAQGAHDEAMDKVQEVLKHEPKLYAAHELKLNIIFAQKVEPERVRSAVFELLKEFPEKPNAELMAGRAYRALGNVADARMHLRRAVEAARFDSKMLFDIANQQYAIGDFSGALWTLTKAVQGSPDHLGAGVLKAAVHTELKEFEKAETVIEGLRAKHGETPEIMTVQGDLLMAQNRFEDAVTSYGRSYQLAPVVGPMRTLFRAQIAAGKLNDAAILIENWLEAHPQDLGSMHLYAQMLMTQNDWSKASAVYEKLQSDGVEDIVMLNNLAVCYQHLGDARALLTAELAYEQAPSDPSVADTYGWILLENDRIEEGLALLREAYARSSTSPAIRYHIGLALARLGRNDEAQEEIEAALANADAFSARDDATKLLDKLRKSVD